MDFITEEEEEESATRTTFSHASQQPALLPVLSGLYIYMRGNESCRGSGNLHAHPQHVYYDSGTREYSSIVRVLQVIHYKLIGAEVMRWGLRTCVLQFVRAEPLAAHAAAPAPINHTAVVLRNGALASAVTDERMSCMLMSPSSSADARAAFDGVLGLLLSTSAPTLLIDELDDDVLC